MLKDCLTLVAPKRNLALQHLQYKTMLLSGGVEANSGEPNRDWTKGCSPLPLDGEVGKAEDERSTFTFSHVKKRSMHDILFELPFLKLVMLSLFQPA